MNVVQKLSIIVVAALIPASCDFIQRAFTYKDKTKELIGDLISEDYGNVMRSFALENEMARNTDTSAMKQGLVKFREALIRDFGTNLSFRFMKAEKTWANKSEEGTPPNTTLAQIEFSNEKEFGVFQVLFDDTSGKILNINKLDVRLPIPNMTLFWLFGILTLCVPVFNIYVIRKVRASQQKKKWLKYLAIFMLNVPAFTYAAVGGLSFRLLNFQILLGFSFGYMGYMNSFWTFGLPLGGLYWFFKLRNEDNDLPDAEGAKIGEADADGVPAP